MIRFSLPFKSTVITKVIICAKNHLSILEVDTKSFSADDLILNVSKNLILIEYLQTVRIPFLQSKFSKFGILQSTFWGKRQFRKRRCNLK